MGNCKYCGGKSRLSAGASTRSASPIIKPAGSGWWRWWPQAAGQSDFSEAALLDNLSAIARDSHIGDDGIRAVIAEGWHQAVTEGLADGILTQDEEARLRDFRDQFALDDQWDKTSQDIGEQLDRASRDRLMLDARLAALATADGDTHRNELAAMLEESELSAVEQQLLLAQAWEAAVDGTLEDGVLSLDEENALVQYLRHFRLVTNFSGRQRGLPEYDQVGGHPRGC